jgi:CRISPR-associated protein Csm1
VEATIDPQQDELLLGALLHDVGKLLIRSRRSDEGKDHTELGEEWLLQYRDRLPPDVAHFARLHHSRYFSEIRQSNLTLLVYHADQLSAAGDRIDKGGTYDYRGTPLASIFSRVSFTNDGPPSQKFLPLQPLGPEMLIPRPLEHIDLGDVAYDRLLQGFTRDFEKWLSMGRPAGCLPLLLEKYWSTIPSETQRVWRDEHTFPDVSLYDHTKATAAFALALYRYFQEVAPVTVAHAIIPDLDQVGLDQAKPYFRLIGGDFSGVQRFIYTISSRGALKGLRGRSFFLELLTEHVADELLKALGLSRPNLIFAGGGHFYILCQNTPHAERVIQAYHERIVAWARERFRLALYLTMDGVAATAADLTTDAVTHLWQGVAERLALQKAQRFRHELPTLMRPLEPLLEDCTVCHRDDLSPNDIGLLRQDDPESRACWFCRDLYEFGDDLARNPVYLIGQRVTSEVSRRALALPCSDQTSLMYRVSSDTKGVPACERGFVINRWELDAYIHPALVPLFYASHVPQVRDLPEYVKKLERDRDPQVQEDATASLIGLARAATGIDRVAALRMDVDYMGKILTRGFHPPSFSCLASFSRQLNLFFKFHLNAVCQGDSRCVEAPLNLTKKSWGPKGRALAVIYSGGEDLFVIGAWDEVAEFAVDVHHSFQRFTGNPEITLSGGLVIQDPHFPLYHMAEEAGRAEGQAKGEGRNRLMLAFFPQSPATPSGRNPISVYPWGDLTAHVLPLIKQFLTLRKEDPAARHVELQLPRSLIYRLFSLIEEWQQEGQLYLPRMAYAVSRLRQEVERKRMHIAWGDLQAALMTPANMAHLKTVLIWLELLCRSDRGEEPTT